MNSNSEVKIDEKVKKKTKMPKRYNVVILNDNQTPFDWVMELLTTIFQHDPQTAEHLTMSIHESGSAVVGNYSYEIAEQKSVEATTASRENGFLLQIIVDKE